VTVHWIIQDPTLALATALARAGGRLLVVNSQFDKRPPAGPVLPFTVSAVVPRGRPTVGP
jgi:hypothetical protein